MSERVSTSTQVLVNDQPTFLPEAGTLRALLESLGLAEQKGIAVALGDQVIPRGMWSETQLSENQKVTVIKATQGG